MTDPQPTHQNPPYRGKANTSDLNQALQLIEALQEQLDQAKECQAHAQRLQTLGTLSATLAHELNNLLAPIRSYAQLAETAPDDTAMAGKLVQASLRGTEQAARLIQATLDFAQGDVESATQDHARAEGGGAGEQSDQGSRLQAVLDHAIDCVRPILDRCGMNIDRPRQDAELAIDALALQQVLVNLLTNAVDAIQRAGVAGRLQLTIEIAAGRCRIELHDNGPGIPVDLGERVFEPYVTQHLFETCVGNSSARIERRSGLSGQRRGSGLGLSVCRDLINAAGGSIGLIPPVLGGAGFRIELPIAG